ncbi:hypothetical protein DPMN_136685 [Dreissena polymorpha]|uniref:EF-hand domain-containing protein n=2 Tax=Dreissena polymorpha TaxID=45954 RepID=A0A9D4G1B5_DREPO|nr:hypothetical protein DPMN_136685 [Dreissena polymorpha]
MILSRLSELFGNSSEFTLEIASNMREMILEDLRSGRKEEYMSKAGLALLFDRSGGSLNEVMRDIITADEAQGPYEKRLLEEIRQRWNEWDLRDAEQNDDMLQYDSFYNGFLAPYFSCYRCFDTKQALQALDMDADGYVDWKEFLVYLKWAFRQYPDVKDANELLDVAFQKGLIPAMRDERISSKEQRID